MSTFPKARGYRPFAPPTKSDLNLIRARESVLKMPLERLTDEEERARVQAMEMPVDFREFQRQQYRQILEAQLEELQEFYAGLGFDDPLPLADAARCTHFEFNRFVIMSAEITCDVFRRLGVEIRFDGGTTIVSPRMQAREMWVRNTLYPSSSLWGWSLQKLAKQKIAVTTVEEELLIQLYLRRLRPVTSPPRLIPTQSYWKDSGWNVAVLPDGEDFILGRIGPSQVFQHCPAREVRLAT